MKQRPAAAAQGIVAGRRIYDGWAPDLCWIGVGFMLVWRLIYFVGRPIYVDWTSYLCWLGVRSMLVDVQSMLAGRHIYVG